jgi:hypothetical protein
MTLTIEQLINEIIKYDKDMEIKVMKPQDYSAVYYDLVTPVLAFDEIDDKEVLVLEYQ